METDELKFLLKLLGCPNYRSTLSASIFKGLTGKEKICRDLSDRGLVDFSREIASVKILSPGSELLKIDKDQLPLTPHELKVLEKIGKTSGKMKPSEIAVKSVKLAERDAILQRFDERGLIAAENKIKRQNAQVWLTQRGEDYLREDYIPKKGSNPVVSLDLLTNYLRFLRKSQHSQSNESLTQAQLSSEAAQQKSQLSQNNGSLTQKQLEAPSGAKTTEISQPSDKEILQTIQDLDRHLGTKNYLPIFHLRQKFQPPLSREDFDQVLYRLQRNDLIELSSLQEAIAYTPEQIKAGIPQDIGGPLFFITVNQ